jgi:hypothetical protein
LGQYRFFERLCSKLEFEKVLSGLPVIQDRPSADGRRRHFNEAVRRPTYGQDHSEPLGESVLGGWLYLSIICQPTRRSDASAPEASLAALYLDILIATEECYRRVSKSESKPSLAWDRTGTVLLRQSRHPPNQRWTVTILSRRAKYILTDAQPCGLMYLNEILRSITYGVWVQRKDTGRCLALM